MARKIKKIDRTQRGPTPYEQAKLNEYRAKTVVCGQCKEERSYHSHAIENVLKTDVLCIYGSCKCGVLRVVIRDPGIPRQGGLF